MITKKKKLQQQLQQQQVQLKQKIIQVRGQIAKITATASLKKDAKDH